MDRRLALLIVLGAAFQIGESMKCYTCTTLSDPKCADPMENQSSAECSSELANTASQYLNTLSNQLSSFASAIGFNANKLPTIDTKFSCSKIEFAESGKDVIVRGCWATSLDFCEELKKRGSKEVKFCETCDTDLCNSATLPNLSLFMLFLMPSIALLIASN